MLAIGKEENKIEEYKNQSYDIEKLGVSGEIACTKMLIASTGLCKAKAKALLQTTLTVSNPPILLLYYCDTCTYYIA